MTRRALLATLGQVRSWCLRVFILRSCRQQAWRPRRYSNDFRPSTLDRHHNMSTNATCCNCGFRHPGAASPNCFFASLRLSGRDPLALASTACPEKHIRIIPKDTRLRHELRNEIWQQFLYIKADSELRRYNLAVDGYGVTKGELKAREPIPWLSWCSLDGRKGQTRSEGNFMTLWETRVEAVIRSYHGTRPFYLTSPLMDAPTDYESGDDENDGQNRFAALPKISRSPC